MLIAEDIQIEWDEGGCYLMVDGERWLVSDPEQLYDRVKAAIGPWLYERDQARAEYEFSRRHLEAARFVCSPEDVDESGGYSIRADLYDQERDR